METLPTYNILPMNGANPQRAVIFLHGLGDRGDGGLLDLGRIWQPYLPDCAFLCPDAPFPFDMANDGFVGRQWFSLQSHDPADMLAGVKETAPILNRYIDEVLDTYRLSAKQLVLVGFSQGTMMSLYVAPRRDEQLAGVIGYSGSLLGGDTLTQEKKSTPPVLLVHGRMDMVVPYAAMHKAEATLKTNGFCTETVTCPELGHSIDDAGIQSGLNFLLKAFA